MLVLRELSPGLYVEIKYRTMINRSMGAACSSSSKKKYNDAINYLKSKSCMTFTYSRGFSPLAKNMPHVILVGENHFENPSIKGNCGTISGLLNELVSICKDPISRLTIFTEDEPDDVHGEDVCYYRHMPRHTYGNEYSNSTDDYIPLLTSIALEGDMTCVHKYRWSSTTIDSSIEYLEGEIYDILDCIDDDTISSEYAETLTISKRTRDKYKDDLGDIYKRHLQRVAVDQIHS